MSVTGASWAPLLRPANLFTDNIRRIKQLAIQHQAQVRQNVAAQSAQIQAKLRATQVNNVWPPPYKGANIELLA